MSTNPSSPAPRGPWRLLPPLAVLLVSLGLLAYRVATPDWDWFWGAPPAPRLEALAMAPPDPSPAVDVPVSPPGPIQQPPEAPADDGRDAPPIPETETDPDEEVFREAEKARAQRDEIARFKEKEADRLAERPPPQPRFPGPGGGVDGRQFERWLRQQRAIEAEMDALIAQHFQQFDELVNAQRDQLRRDMERHGARPRGVQPGPQFHVLPFPEFGARDLFKEFFRAPRPGPPARPQPFQEWGPRPQAPQPRRAGPPARQDRPAPVDPKTYAMRESGPRTYVPVWS